MCSFECRKQTDWWRSRSSCDSEWTRCWSRWLERGCSRSSSPEGRTARWRSGHLPSLCRCPPPKQHTATRRGQTKYVQFLTLPLPETSAAKDRHASAPGSFKQHNIKPVTHPPTLMRQALLTSCLGSTTSTSGSLIATSLMHDISKPYTFSHPDTKAQTQSCQFTENTWRTAGGI